MNERVGPGNKQVITFRQKAERYIIGVVSLVAFVLLIAENTTFGDTHPVFFRTVNFGVWFLFIVEVLSHVVTSNDKVAYLRSHWIEGIVFIPLIQYVPGAHHPGVFSVVRQVVIAVMLISRIRRARSLVKLLELKPAQLMLTGFLAAIGVGTVLLMLPAATVSGARMPLIDAAFTATSAICVTGLIVEDTATYFTLYGQLVILALIQIGGLGIMTFSVSLAVLLGKKMGVGQRAALRDALDHDTLAGVRRLIRFIVLMTFGFELVGGVCLFLSWHGRFDSVPLAIYHSFFHAISAFCNAGFSTFSGSLMQFQHNAGVNVSICGLIIFGGLGFAVIQGLLGVFRARLGRGPGNRIRLQMRIVLRMTFFLILVGAALVLVTEWTGQLEGLRTNSRVLSAFFQSVTARTAGFNTMDIGALSSATLFLTIVLMFIGASPGSTGGGIKTTTVVCLWAAVVTSLRNRPHVEMHRRTIPDETVYKAFTLLCLSLGVVIVFTLVLLVTEAKPFMDVLFETVSAFGTVGLSTGLTSELSTAGRILIMILMFIGRLGPLTVTYAMLPTHARVNYKYAEERIMIG